MVSFPPHSCQAVEDHERASLRLSVREDTQRREKCVGRGLAYPSMWTVVSGRPLGAGRSTVSVGPTLSHAIAIVRLASFAWTE